MQIKRSVAMVLNWPEIQTRTFDFATFSRKEKPYADAKQEYEKQVNELTDWIDRARHYAQAIGHGGPSDFERDVKLEALAPVVRGQLPVLVFADRARDIRNAVEFCDKQKLKNDSGRRRRSLQSERLAPLQEYSGYSAPGAFACPMKKTTPTIGCFLSPPSYRSPE